MIFKDIIKLPKELKNATISELYIDTNISISTNIEKDYAKISPACVDITLIVFMDSNEFKNQGEYNGFFDLDIKIGNYKGKLQLQALKSHGLIMEIGFKVTGITNA